MLLFLHQRHLTHDFIKPIRCEKIVFAFEIERKKENNVRRGGGGGGLTMRFGTDLNGLYDVKRVKID